MKKTLTLLALAAAALLAGCTKEQAPEADQAAAAPVDAVAYVNGEPISKEMFNFHLQRRTGGQPGRAGAEDREMLLNELVDMTLLAQQARKQGLEKDPVIAGRIQNLENAILAQAAVERVTKQGQTEEAVKAEYDKRFGVEQKEYHARHILVDSQEKAQAVIDKLNGGADFAKLAQEHSTGPTGPNGGDLGWFQAEQMVPPFAEAVKKMEPGTYTKEPVQTRFGWHVIRLEETRPIPPPSLDEVREQLQSALTQQSVENHIAELRKQADIRFQKEDAPAAEQPSAVEAQPRAAEQPAQQSGQ